MVRSHAMTVGQLARRTGAPIKTLRTRRGTWGSSPPQALAGATTACLAKKQGGVCRWSRACARLRLTLKEIRALVTCYLKRPAGRIPGADCRPNRGSDGHSAGAASTHPGIPGRQHRRASPPCCLKTGAVVGTRSTSLSVAPCHLPLDALTRRERVHCSQAPQGGEKKPNRARIMCSV